MCKICIIGSCLALNYSIERRQIDNSGKKSPIHAKKPAFDHKYLSSVEIAANEAKKSRLTHLKNERAKPSVGLFF